MVFLINLRYNFSSLRFTMNLLELWACRMRQVRRPVITMFVTSGTEKRAGAMALTWAVKAV
jgi:hypothetical protein